MLKQGKDYFWSLSKQDQMLRAKRFETTMNFENITIPYSRRWNVPSHTYKMLEEIKNGETINKKLIQNLKKKKHSGKNDWKCDIILFCDSVLFSHTKFNRKY